MSDSKKASMVRTIPVSRDGWDHLATIVGTGSVWDGAMVPCVLLCDENGEPRILNADVIELFSRYPGVVIIDPQTGEVVDVQAILREGRDA